MSSSSLTSAKLQRRFRWTATGLILLLGTSTAWSFHDGYARKHDQSGYHAANKNYRHRVTPSAAQQAATLAVTQMFRRDTVRATQRFALETAHLVRDLQRGDRAAARRDELQAQSTLDVIRLALPAGVRSTAPLDTLVSNQPPGLAPTGLHAVEMALWNGNMARALPAANSLMTTGQQLPYVLLRTIVTPTDLCLRLNESLSWTVENVIDSSQERFSHRDLVDVHAVVDSTSSLVKAIDKLAVLIDRPAAQLLKKRMASLEKSLSVLPATFTNSQVSEATWRRLAQQIDAVEMALGPVGGALTGFGTGRPYA